MAAVTGLAGVAASPVWGQGTDYTYVKMSLGVPWALYFVFLAGVLLPFVVMIVLAWRSAAQSEPEMMDNRADAPSGEPTQAEP